MNNIHDQKYSGYYHECVFDSFNMTGKKKKYLLMSDDYKNKTFSCGYINVKSFKKLIWINLR